MGLLRATADADRIVDGDIEGGMVFRACGKLRADRRAAKAGEEVRADAAVRGGAGINGDAGGARVYQRVYMP